MTTTTHPFTLQLHHHAPYFHILRATNTRTIRIHTLTATHHIR